MIGCDGAHSVVRDRAGIRRRGQVALSQDEAWDFMTTLGPTLSAAGFDVRVPAMSRRKAKPTLRLFADTPAGSVVGAHQLANVAWTILFDDLELTAAEVQHLARQARPLVRANGKWVEVDRADLEKAAAALADRAAINTPIQGSAADLVKLAMLRVHDALARRGGSARLLLQVHDELLIECRESEREAIADLVRREMEGCYPLRVPLTVSVGTGATWYDVH